MTDSSVRRLSVCMIVKNEAALLKRCLESAGPVADEIVVVDTGSTDGTQDIAVKLGAKLVQSEWRDDFSYSRNISIEHATCDWILWLDADDVVPHESILKINELKHGKPDKVYSLIVRNQKPGNIGSEFVQARMFPNNPALRFERRIHEQIAPSALRLGIPLVAFPVVIEHHGYADPQELKRKAGRNARLLVQDYDASHPCAVTAVEIGDSYFIIEEQELARQWYERALAISGCERETPVIASQAHLGLGNLANKNEEYEQAIRHLKEAVRLCPGRADAMYALAVAYDLSEQRIAAIELLKQILDTPPTYVQVSVDSRQAKIKSYLRLPRLLLAEKKEGELLALVERALREFGERPEIHNMAGISYFRIGRLMDGMHCFEKSIGIAVEGNIDAYVGLCAIYRAAGRPDVMNATLSQIVEPFRRSPRYWAFCLIVKDKDTITLPEEMDEKVVRKEVEYLRKTLGI